MRNFLVAIVLNNNEEFYFWIKEVKTTNPNEVICPEKTLYFFFKKGENIDDVRKELVYFKIGWNFVFPRDIADDEKMYIIGRQISEDEVLNLGCGLVVTIDNDVTVIEE